MKTIAIVLTLFLSLQTVAQTSDPAGTAVPAAPAEAAAVQAPVPAPAAIPTPELSAWEKVTVAVKVWWDQVVKPMIAANSPAAPTPTAQTQSQTQAQAPESAALPPAVAPGSTSAPAPASAPPPLAPMVVSQEVRHAMTNLPTVESSHRSTAQEKVQEIAKAVKSNKVIQVAKPGRAATSAELQMSKRGVPQYVPLLADKKSHKIPAVKAIPRLDIGSEPELSAHDFVLPEIPRGLAQVKRGEALKSPSLTADKEIKSMTHMVMLPMGDLKAVEKLKGKVDQVVTKEAIEKTKPVLVADSAVVLKPFAPFTEAELKFLASRILIDHERCVIALGLLNDLQNDKTLEHDAKFYAGYCAHRMKLFTEAVAWLSDSVRQENGEYAPQALDMLLSPMPVSFQGPIADLIMNMKNKAMVPQEKLDHANYLMAKQAYRKHHLEQMMSYAEKVAEKSDDYGSARYLMAIGLYDMDKLPKAAQMLETVRAWESSHSDKNLSALAAMTMARIRFKQKSFKEAQALFKEVDKEHPYWIQALVEQGWTQIYLDDAGGAIGNMYSLHSPFFTAVYKPESYVVRTIGYLNICQFGDAYRTLSVLEKDYRPWRVQVQNYLARNPSADQNYQMLKMYLRGKPSDGVEGMSPQVLREIARRRDFLNEQTALNEKEDELARFTWADDKLASEKAKLKARMDQARLRLSQIEVNLEKAKVNKELAKNVDQWKAQARLERDVIVGYKYVVQVYEEGRQGMMRLKGTGTRHIDTDKLALRARAGRVIAAHLKTIDKDIGKMLDNNEFLRYEVFSGSGENIRFQVTGGEAKGSGRVPASSRPEKNLHWDFDGEYWQDEIGNYRSSLKDNCPNSREGA